MDLIFRFKDDNGVAQTLIQNSYLLLIGGNDDGVMLELKFLNRNVTQLFHFI